MSYPTVGILGGGQLGRMLVESANRLGIPTKTLDEANAPAKQVNGPHDNTYGSFKDEAAVMALAERCDVLTVEIEHVNVEALKKVQDRVEIYPDPRVIEIIQDKYAQREFLAHGGIEQPQYMKLESNSEDQLYAVARRFGYPFMLKSRTLAYDGRGNYKVSSPADIRSALDFMGERPLYAEEWLNFVCELAVIVVATDSGAILAFPTVETVQEDSICRLVYAPPRAVAPHVLSTAQALARSAVQLLGSRGCYGVEMFLMPDGSIKICEIACRVHNSGHYTIEGCSISQFDAHMRAILGIPIPPGSLELRSPAVMVNILGGRTADEHMELVTRALSVPGATVHLYGKGDGRPGRKMGHITVTADSIQKADALSQTLLFRDRVDVEHAVVNSSGSSKCLVAVLMGSDSDLATLAPGLKLLDELLPEKPEVVITSAHRTPGYMAEYAASAAKRGIKVIIAAAGGAAHLPGMVAAYTSLPVIGVPVKASVLDGLDSLYSIVQMPRGVPVAAVGINNSTNAALLAARIVGAFDPAVSEKVEKFAEQARVSNLHDKNPLLQRIGWERYLQHMKEETH